MCIDDMIRCMRTTIELDDDLHVTVKRLAAERGCTMQEIVQDALRESLTRQFGTQRPRTELPVFHGTGVLPGVDLEDSPALLEIMGEHHGSG